MHEYPHKKLRLIATATLMMAVLLAGRHLYEWYLRSALTNELQNGLTEELHYLVNQGNEVALNPKIKEYLLQKEYVELLATLSAEKNERGIGLMGIANEEGIIVTRTRSILSTGENALEMSPQGRALAAGAPVVSSVEVSSFDPTQVLMTTGRRILDDGQVIGYLFANHLLDDAYALNFAKRYFHEGVITPHIAFYTNDNGVYGTSFEDGSARALSRTYFATIDAAQRLNGRVDTVWIMGLPYRVTSIPFDGLEGETTGALLFIPFVPWFVLLLVTFITMLLAYPLTHYKLHIKVRQTR